MTVAELMDMGILDEKLALEVFQLIESQVQKGKALEEELAKLEEEGKAVATGFEQRLLDMAIDFAIKEAGGKNKKAILPFLNLEEVRFDEKGNLTGLSLDQVKEEVPYLFGQMEKAVVGTGLSSYEKRKENKDVAKKFRDALMRRQ